MTKRRMYKGYWQNNPKNVDLAFDKIKEIYGRSIKVVYLIERYPGAYLAITRGDYNPKVKNWNDYLRHRGEEVKHEKGIWTPSQVDKVFDLLKKEKNKNFTSDEFRKRFSSALDVILSGRYNPKVKNWNDYLRHRGEEVKHEKGIWTPSQVDKVFDKLELKLKRTPSSREFRTEYPGASNIILKGIYSNKVKNWNDYLTYRKKEIRKIWGVLKPEEIDVAYDNLFNELGRRPKKDEFKRKHSGLYLLMTQGKYSKDITRWSEYVEYRTNVSKNLRQSTESLLEGWVND